MIHMMTRAHQNTKIFTISFFHCHWHRKRHRLRSCSLPHGTIVFHTGPPLPSTMHDQAHRFTATNLLLVALSQSSCHPSSMNHPILSLASHLFTYQTTFTTETLVIESIVRGKLPHSFYVKWPLCFHDIRTMSDWSRPNVPDHTTTYQREHDPFWRTSRRAAIACWRWVLLGGSSF